MADQLEDTMPEWLKPPPDTPEYMLPAWFGALHHALGDEGIVAALPACMTERRNNV